MGVAGAEFLLPVTSTEKKNDITITAVQGCYISFDPGSFHPEKNTILLPKLEEMEEIQNLAEKNRIFHWQKLLNNHGYNNKTDVERWQTLDHPRSINPNMINHVPQQLPIIF